MLNAPAKTTVLTTENISAITQLEQLKRLLRHRRFSKNDIERMRTQLERHTYIRLALDLGKQADYNERRLFRLGHEFNRSFETSMSPADAHELIAIENEHDVRGWGAEDWADMLGMTDEEYAVITKTDNSTYVGKETFE